jgi:hypothetical protein
MRKLTKQAAARRGDAKKETAFSAAAPMRHSSLARTARWRARSARCADAEDSTVRLALAARAPRLGCQRVASVLRCTFRHARYHAEKLTTIFARVSSARHSAARTRAAADAACLRWRAHRRYTGATQALVACAPASVVGRPAMRHRRRRRRHL